MIKALCLQAHGLQVVAGVRDPVNSAGYFNKAQVRCIRIDLEDTATFSPALRGVDILFLLRPPQISDVDRYFKPLLDPALVRKVKHIAFLSVQGVENSTIIPHHKIERLIRESGIPYTFLSPAYFMQNFTTTLRKDLVEHDRSRPVNSTCYREAIPRCRW